MPVRSLNSSLMRWPSRETVDAAVRQWAQRLAEHVPAVKAVGYFGSYARGEASVGSDVDLLVLTDAPISPDQRMPDPWAVERLPVPAETFVYDIEQWQQLAHQRPRFYKTLQDETVWVVKRD